MVALRRFAELRKAVETPPAPLAEGANTADKTTTVSAKATRAVREEWSVAAGFKPAVGAASLPPVPAGPDEMMPLALAGWKPATTVVLAQRAPKPRCSGATSLFLLTWQGSSLGSGCISAQRSATGFEFKHRAFRRRNACGSTQVGWAASGTREQEDSCGVLDVRCLSLANQRSGFRIRGSAPTSGGLRGCMNITRPSHVH